MSINKSQGQTLKVVGLQLQEDCFSLGQLYVGCSRVEMANKLHIYSYFGKTKHILCKKSTIEFISFTEVKVII